MKLIKLTALNGSAIYLDLDTIVAMHDIPPITIDGKDVPRRTSIEYRGGGNNLATVIESPEQIISAQPIGGGA